MLQIQQDQFVDERRRGDNRPSQQYLVFHLGDEVFSMDIRAVREIIQFEAIAPVPMAPDFVRGVFNLRGSVVPVIDLQARLGRPASSVGKKTCIVVYESQQAEEKSALGVLVDAVYEVVDVCDEDIEPAPQFGASIAREFIRGLTKHEDRFIVILDA